MRSVVPVFVCCCCLVAPALADDPVYFADPALKAAVEDELWIEDPTPTDMLGLVRLSYPNTWSEYTGITSLTGLEHAANLQSLNLRGHRIGSIAPLAGLVHLETLILLRNRIVDISPLSALTNLRKLDLERNDVYDISVLSRLKKLQWLSLHRNDVSNLSALTKLTSLTYLDLRINPLNEDAFDEDIPEIKVNNPGIYFVHDPAFYRRLRLESTLGGTVTDPGEGDFLYEYDDLVWVFAEAKPGYDFAEFAGSYTISQNPTQIQMLEDYRMTARFVSQLSTIYVDDDAAHDPGPNNAYLCDPLEDGTTEHPFDGIQKAIDVAARGARIVVRPGRYYETLTLGGKRITVTSIDPDTGGRDDRPIIDGQGRSPVVSFVSREGLDCLLEGFVITGGRGPEAGAILCSDSSPTIANCLIVGNRTIDPNGAAVRCLRSEAAFVNCTVADNWGNAPSSGLRITGGHVTIGNSIIWGNGSDEIIASEADVVTVTYSDVAGGWPGVGNLNADPLFAKLGTWVDPGHAHRELEPGNPRAVWTGSDYHLKSQGGRWDTGTQAWAFDGVTSPCIDAGDPLEAVGLEPYPNRAAINLGAYGGTAQASRSN